MTRDIFQAVPEQSQFSDAGSVRGSARTHILGDAVQAPSQDELESRGGGGLLDTSFKVVREGAAVSSQASFLIRWTSSGPQCTTTVHLWAIEDER